ncbi:MAG TPA: hypothetical protein VF137_08625 [Candidatus Dormibacteraeota bacterium]
MPASSSRPKQPAAPDTSERPGVEDFTRSVHASYLSRWLSHDPSALEEAARREATGRKRKKRTSAA